MKKQRHKSKGKGGRRRGPAEHPNVKLETRFTHAQVSRLNNLFSKSAELAFKYAIEVLGNKDQIEVRQYTKEGQVKKYFTDKIPVDIKVRVMEFIGNKVFPDKKVIETNYGTDPSDPSPRVIGFNFKLADTSKNAEAQLKQETIAALKKEKGV